jgi:GT2 family glycosyltransferase
MLVSRFITGQASVPCTCSIVVRRSVLDAVGGFDETFRDLYEDQALYSRIALRYPIVADDQVLDRYRQHSDSMTARADAAHEAGARLRFLDWLEREITRAGVTDVELAQSVARERWKLAHPRLARLLRTVRRTARGLLSGIGQRSAGPTGRSDTRGATNAS